MGFIHDCHNTGLELRRHYKLEEVKLCTYQVYIVCSTEHFIYCKESKLVVSVLISALTLVVYP